MRNWQFFCQSRSFARFMKPKGSLPYSQQPITGLCPKPRNESSHSPPKSPIHFLSPLNVLLPLLIPFCLIWRLAASKTYLLKVIFKILPTPILRSPASHLPLIFSGKRVCSVITAVCATWSVHLILLDLINSLISFEDQLRKSSPRNFLHLLLPHVLGRKALWALHSHSIG